MSQFLLVNMMQNSTNHVDYKDAQSKSCELNFLWGKMRTAAWETAPQIALRECFKVAGGGGVNTKDFGETGVQCYQALIL